MSKIAYSGKLLRQFAQFAYRQKVYWIVPLIVLAIHSATRSTVSIVTTAPVDRGGERDP